MMRFISVLVLLSVFMLFPIATMGQDSFERNNESLSLSAPAFQGETEKSGLAGALGIRAAVGTDVNLGLGFGLGASYSWFPKSHAIRLELGADIFYHHSKEEDSDEDYYATYDEETELTIIAIRANGLFNYYPGEGRAFFIAGVGFVAASVYWEETQTPFNTGVSRPYDDSEGTTTGNIINFGAGYAFTNGLEFRVEAPLLFFYSQYGNSTKFAPTVTATLQFLFL
jgi:hypothetical protein